jgi:ATP-dependent helicase/DNAse subunit B
MHTLLSNTAFSETTARTVFSDLLDTLLKSKRYSDIHLICPTGKLVRKFKFDIIKKYYALEKKAVAMPKIFTFQSFASFCYKQLLPESRLRLISDAYRLALFEEAAGKTDFSFFRKNDGSLSLGVLKRLASIITGLKEDGISPEDIERDLASDVEVETIKDRKRLRDIWLLYTSYQSLLSNETTDFQDLLKKFNLMAKTYAEAAQAEQLQDVSMSLFDKVFKPQDIIIFLGFSEFKQPEFSFISHFSQSKTPVCLYFDYDSDNGPLFGNIEDNVLQLCKSGFRLVELDAYSDLKSQSDSINTESKSKKNTHISRYYSQNVSAYIRRWLFNTEQDCENKSLASMIGIFAANDRLDEVRSIGKLVRYLIKTGFAKPSEVCIVSPKPETYAELFRDEFREMNIPANITDRYNLSQSPVINAIFNVLQYNVSANKLIEIKKLLKNELLVYPFETNADFKKKFASKRLLKVLNQYSRLDNLPFIDLEFMKRVLKSRAELLRRKIQNPDIITDSRDLKEKELEIKDLDEAIHSIEILPEIFENAGKILNPKEFAAFVKHAIIRKFRLDLILTNKMNVVDINVPRNVNNLYLKENIEKECRALTTFIELLNEFAFILEHRFPGKRFEMKELVSRLRIAVSGEKYQIHEKQGFGVEITSIEQTRGIPYKVMILCGAVDKEIPMQYMPEKFLGKELPDTERRHHNSERMKFYQFLSNAPELLNSCGKKIYVFYPKHSGTTELVPSPYIDALLKICGDKNKNIVGDLSKIRRTLESIDGGESAILFSEDVSWLNSIASKRELLLHESLKMSDALKDGSSIAETGNKYGKKSLVDESGDVFDFYLNYGKRSDNLVKEYLNQKTTDFLENQRNRPVSISELETYAKCPFKYFATYLLRLSDEIEPDIIMSGMDLGNMIHKTLYLFYSRLQTEIQGGTSSGILPPAVQLIPEEKNRYLRMLKEIASEEINAFKTDFPLFKFDEDRVLGSELNPGLLSIWLNSEFENIGKKHGFNPCFFEFDFSERNSGITEKNSDSKRIAPVELSPRLLLGGKVDRIEISENSTYPYFLIADYKSNSHSAAKLNDITKGLSFQMPLYMAAVQTIFRRDYKLDFQPGGAVYLYYEPKYDQDSATYNSMDYAMANADAFPAGAHGRKRFVKSGEDIQLILESSISMAEDIVCKIAEGRFPAEPAKADVCNYCGFGGICRIKEK